MPAFSTDYLPPQYSYARSTLKIKFEQRKALKFGGESSN
jgi:hypothetical protein